VHHVQGHGLQAEQVARPQQRRPALDLQRLQVAVPPVGHRLAQPLVGRAEPPEHVHERPAAGRPLGRHDPLGVGEGGGER